MADSVQISAAPLGSSHLATPPEGALSRFFDLPARQGVSAARLRVCLWPNEGRRTRWCLLLNGRTEFVEKYYEVIDDLMRRGFGVITLDWRGQGLSSRFGSTDEVGHIDRFETFVEDLEVVIDALSGEIGDAPFVVLGHSMGGHLALRYGARNAARCEALALSAPMTGVHLPLPRLVMEPLLKLFIALGKGNRFILSRGALGDDWDDFDSNVVTSDPERFAHDISLMVCNPALRLGGPSYQWVAEALKSMDHVMSPEFADGLRMPVLLASARGDQIVIPQTHNEFMARVRGGKLVEIESAQHEILRERDLFRTQFWDAFDAMI